MPTATSTSAAAAAVGPTGCPFSPTRQCSGFPGGPTFDPLNLATAPGGGSSASISLPGDQSARGRPSEREKSRGDLSARRRHRLSPFSQEAAYARAGLLSPRPARTPRLSCAVPRATRRRRPATRRTCRRPRARAPPRLRCRDVSPTPTGCSRRAVSRGPTAQLPPAGAPTRRRRLRRRRRPRRRPGVVSGVAGTAAPTSTPPVITPTAAPPSAGSEAVRSSQHWLEREMELSMRADDDEEQEAAAAAEAAAGGSGGGGGAGGGGRGGGGGGARSGGGGGGAVPRALAAPHAVVGPRHRRHRSDAARRHRFPSPPRAPPASAPSPRASAAQSNSPTSARFAALEAQIDSQQQMMAMMQQQQLQIAVISRSRPSLPGSAAGSRRFRPPRRARRRQRPPPSRARGCRRGGRRRGGERALLMCRRRCATASP